jgi:N-alpha-acetyltransferase 15/16, NatA auxiliary subunit
LRDILDQPPAGTSPILSEIIRSETKTLLPEDKDLSGWNDKFLDRHKSSVPHLQAGLRVRALIGKEGKEKNETDLLATLSLDSISMNDASAGLELLYEWGSSATVKDKYRNSAAERWNRASIFQAKHT